MKPRKKYIREELIKEIKAEIKEIENKLFRQWDALKFAYLGDFKTEIEDYKGKEWYVSIEIPYPGPDNLADYRQYLFIDKKTGKNRYPKEEEKE